MPESDDSDNGWTSRVVIGAAILVAGAIYVYKTTRKWKDFGIQVKYNI